MTSTTPYGAIGIQSSFTLKFKVNGQRLKHFVEKHVGIVESVTLQDYDFRIGCIEPLRCSFVQLDTKRSNSWEAA